MRNSNKAQDYEVEVQNPFQKSKNIQVIDDQDRNIAVLRIYGTIQEPEEYIEELAVLNLLVTKYDAIDLTLNSGGGCLNTAVDIASIINNFKYIITIGKGEIASAAFMLWTMGDVRVVTDYSMYMAHRESYGMYGKTSEHKATATAFGDVYEEMFEKCFGELLTHDEKAVAERSETWISYKDLLDRPGVISFEQYMQPANPYSIMETYISKDGQQFMFDEETHAFRSIKIKFGDEIITDMTDYLYGISAITKIAKKKKLISIKNVKCKVKKPKKDK